MQTPSIEALDMNVIETERLLLKELRPEVMTMLMTGGYTDVQLMKVLGVDESGLVTEKDNFSKGLTNYRLSFRAFVMVEKATGMVIGRCGYHMWYLQHARAEIGYALTDGAAKRKGLMTEAIRAIIAYGFDVMRLNRIEAMVGTANVPSLRILKGCGFKEEGLLRSHYCKDGRMEDSLIFSLLRHEYFAQSAG